MQNETGNSGIFKFPEERGAFPSTKISENSGSKSNGTEIFWKLVSKISVHLSRLFFFLEIWKFRKFPVPFGISSRCESAPVPLVVKSYKMAASLSSQHYSGCKMICHSASLFLIENENIRIWTGRSEFPVGQFARFTYPPARKVRITRPQQGQPLERWTEFFKSNFRKLSVPFEFEPEFPEILVNGTRPTSMHSGDSKS